MRILYIDIDSLRPDHLSCYGYRRQTSPHIDAVAAEGVRFENLYATDSPCLPSRTAFFTGLFGIRTGVVNHGGEYADLPLEGPGRGFRSRLAMESFAACLGRAGYHTASISPFPFRHAAYQIWFGFTETYDTGKGGLENADEMYPPARRWLQANGKTDNWFLHVNFWDPHTPYDHPEAYGNPFADAPMDDWITQDLIDRQNQSFGPHSAAEVPGFTDELPPVWRMGRGRIRTVDDARAHLDGYDTGIHYADHFVGKLIQDLKELGIYAETAIIISADHGENHGELNVWGDHQTADQCTNRLPLIVRWPGVTDRTAGQVRQGLHYHLDLPATILELVGGEQPLAWDGQSFAAELRSPQEGGRDFLVISQGAWSCQRSVRWENWLMIRTYHTGLKAFPEYMLFDLAADPHEITNLASRRPELVAVGLQRMDRWVAAQMYRTQRGDPFWGIIREGGPLHANERSDEWRQYLTRLRATGRGHHADRLERFGGRPFTSGLE
ncbi:MAG: sulfatase [Caldilineaceae bacterium]|nr:sulfatase [Caldilineaceae bacterium]